jgi:hypothetical protein
VLLLIAANMSFIRRFGRGFEKQYDPELVKKYTKGETQKQNNIQEMNDLKKRHEVELDEFREKLSQAEQELQDQLEYQEQKSKEKPEKVVINIDESVNVKSDDDVKKKKD